MMVVVHAEIMGVLKHVGNFLCFREQNSSRVGADLPREPLETTSCVCAGCVHRSPSSAIGNCVGVCNLDHTLYPGIPTCPF